MYKNSPLKTVITKTEKELNIATDRLAFQYKESDLRAAELVIANKELAFQSEEKEKRAAELLIANNELAFQNQEKGKRLAELLIANKELAFQNQEKEKRAAELLIANAELLFQNEEKERRSVELSVAKQKLNERTAQLEAVNTELESFSYSVSHDLRAPLRAVHGYARILKEDYGLLLDTEATRIINNIVANAAKMGHLIDDLLAFSRLGRKELVKIMIRMKLIVEGICHEIKNENPERKIEFIIGELQPALGDSIVMRQVWVNLISNAVKYTRLVENAVIEINSEIHGEEIIYSIKDNGAGFDMRYSAKLFNVFQRLHTQKEFEGTGVGLAIVHRIISKHEGRVWAKGIVGKGATFYFTLHQC